jgi:NTE family protein
VIGKLRFKPVLKLRKQLEAGMNNINATENFRAINYTLNQTIRDDDLNLL